MSPSNGKDRAGLTSILVILPQAGDVQAPHEEDGVDGEGLGASRVPRGPQWHLEVHPGLAQRDETDDHHASQAQCQAHHAADLLGLMQQPPAKGQQCKDAATPALRPAADGPLPVLAPSLATQAGHPRSRYKTLPHLV